MLANDLDDDGDPLEVASPWGRATAPSSLSPSGRFTYSPDGGFVGVDSFSYRASDGIVASAPAVVLLTVSAPPPPPTPDPVPSPEPTPEPTPEPSSTPDPSPTPTASPTRPDRRPHRSHRWTAGRYVVDRWWLDGGGAWRRVRSGRTDLPIANLASSTLGLFGKAFDWPVPGGMLMVPGLLLVVVLLAQMFGALAWLPLVRRKIGGFGFGSEPVRRGGAIH